MAQPGAVGIYTLLPHWSSTFATDCQLSSFYVVYQQLPTYPLHPPSSPIINAYFCVLVTIFLYSIMINHVFLFSLHLPTCMQNAFFFHFRVVRQGFFPRSRKNIFLKSKWKFYPLNAKRENLHPLAKNFANWKTRLHFRQNSLIFHALKNSLKRVLKAHFSLRFIGLRFGKRVKFWSPKSWQIF